MHSLFVLELVHTLVVRSLRHSFKRERGQDSGKAATKQRSVSRFPAPFLTSDMSNADKTSAREVRGSERASGR